MKPAKVAGNRFVLDDAAAGTDMTVTSKAPPAGWFRWATPPPPPCLPAFTVSTPGLRFAGSVEMTEQSGFIALTRAAVA